MTDIVERLRGLHEEARWPVLIQCVAEAADEIARLRAAINNAANSLQATDQTDNAAYRTLRQALAPEK